MQVKNLSGGELQRVALILCLGKPADVYLIDEPSAYLDSEQRIVVSKIIKRFILHAKKTAFVVEHDFIMATFLADQVIVYEGTPGVEATANTPQPLLTGMNKFLGVRARCGFNTKLWSLFLLLPSCLLLAFLPASANRGHVSARPHKLSPARQQAPLGQGRRTKARRGVLLPRR